MDELLLIKDKVTEEHKVSRRVNKLDEKTGLHENGFNPIRSLEPKHILFYYRQIVCLWGAGVAGYVKLQRQTRCR